MTARAFALAMMNGSLQDESLIPFIDGLQQSGYQGISPHPRDGMFVPFGSKPFWERIDRAVGLALERDMEVWFYDEFPYPSGGAGELIPIHHPAARVRHLQLKEIEARPDVNGLIDLGPEPLLALLRFRLDENGVMRDVREVTEYSGTHFHTWVWGEWHNRFYTGTFNVREELHERASAEQYSFVYQPETELGEDRLLAIQLVERPGQKGSPGKPDVALPEVTDMFLEAVYQRYAEIAQKHGLRGAPMFQDETTFYSWYPWNREIEKRLRAVWGDQVFVKLAALGSYQTEDWEYSRYQYRSACSDAIEKNWFVRIAEYCEQHDLQMTGHLPGEESILGHSQLLGDIFKALRHFHIPGYDIISSHLPDDVNRSHSLGPKLVQSVAWLNNLEMTMVEVFGAHGFHNDLQLNRATLAWMSAHDITRVFDHSTYGYSHGLRKYDAPPVSNRFNPLDKGRPDLWQWHNWFADLLEEYVFDPEVLVLFPVDALTRYDYLEEDRWREQVSRLETFFHYLNAHTLDTVYMPSDALDEIEIEANGFRLNGHLFKHLLVPPVESLHEDTFTSLQRLGEHDGFQWIAPSQNGEITIFGEQHPTGATRNVPAKEIISCTEAELLEKKAAWFNGVLQTAVSSIETDTTILKSRRRHRENADETILVLINPNDDAVTVQMPHPGAALPQPPLHYTTDWNGAESTLQLPPRDIVVFRNDGEAQASRAEKLGKAVELRPTEMRYKAEAPNHFSLKIGTAELGGEHYIQPGVVPFRPAPVSSLWPLPLIPYERPDGGHYAPPYSCAPLPYPLPCKVSFPVDTGEALSTLLVAIDAESLPPQTRVFWDELELHAETQDIYDQGNTAWPIPPEGLQIGKHVLRFESELQNAAHGVLERPILVGDFLVATEAPLLLAASPQGWQELPFARTWPHLGLPEGFGPVEYEMEFELPDDSGNLQWSLKLPACVGVAEVRINGEGAGRSSWEPRVLPLGEQLKPGHNTVGIRLYGSWNNVFSGLNRLENGLPQEPILIGEA